MSEWFEEKSADEVTVREVNALAEKLREKKEEHALQKKETTRLWGEVQEIQDKIVRLMEALEIKSFDTPIGKIIVSERETYRLEDADAYREHIGLEAYLNLAKINAQSFSPLVKAEIEDAKDRGDFEYRVPGASEPTKQTTVSLRKK